MRSILLRRPIEHLPDAALGFFFAHETAHLVRYGRGELVDEEAAAGSLDN